MKSSTSGISLALVDDHNLIRGGLKLLLERTLGFKVIIEASNGVELLEKLNSVQALPQIALVDVSMPIMDGYETTQKLTELFPTIKVVALSVHDDLKTINAMIESGANAYLLKESTPEIVKATLLNVQENGYFYTQRVIESFLDSKQQSATAKRSKLGVDPKAELTNREIEFIQYCCSELTYKEIADKMNIVPRTVDGYRESVFLKLDLKSRTGIVLFAFKEGLFKT